MISFPLFSYVFDDVLGIVTNILCIEVPSQKVIHRGLLSTTYYILEDGRYFCTIFAKE